MSRSFAEYLTLASKKHYPKWDSSGLASQFIKHFESGQRIEVDDPIFGAKRGYVGVTTGWRPSFLLLSRVNCISSHILISDETKFLKTIRGKYREE
jgi:hypothetical protein